MFRKALSRVAKLLRTQHNTTQHNRLRSRLSLESLESREVPAIYTWTGVMDTNAANMMNWQVAMSIEPGQPPAPPAGLPDGDDELIFNGSAYFDPITGTSRNCDNLTSLTDSFAAVRIQGGYTGTVMLGESLTFGLFDLASGAISQPTVNRDLTITGTFNWTGGVLNSSGHNSTVNVFGGGDITPANAGTIFLGSSLIFAGAENAPKTTTVNPGSITITQAAANVVIGGFAVVEFRLVAQGDILGITKQQAGLGKIEITQSGKLLCWGLGKYESNLSLYNSGYFGIQQGASATITSNQPLFPNEYRQLGSSVLEIQNGSSLTSHAVNITNGTVFLTMNPNLTANLQTATINGYMSMSGGTILFGAPIGIGGTPFVYGTFTVNGDVNWTGGVYKPSVDYTSAGLGNKWVVNGKLTYTAATCLVEPNPQRGQNPPAASNWTILQATTTSNNPLPPVAQGHPLTLGSFNQNNAIYWKLFSE